MIFGYSIAQTRKFVIAAVAAIVTAGNAFGFPVAEDLSQEVVAIFDAVAAVLVLVVGNEPS